MISRSHLGVQVDGNDIYQSRECKIYFIGKALNFVLETLYLDSSSIPEVNIKQTVGCPDVELGEISEQEIELGINICTSHLWTSGIPAFIIVV